MDSIVKSVGDFESQAILLNPPKVQGETTRFASNRILLNEDKDIKTFANV